MVGPLPRSHLIGVARFQRKQRPTIVQQYPGGFIQQSGAEASKIRLDPAHCVAPLVHRRNVYRVTGVRATAAWRGRNHLSKARCHFSRSHRHIDCPRPLPQIV